MIAAQTAYIARDSGYVEVGTFQLPAAVGANTRLTVKGGLVGIGTVDPTLVPGCPLPLGVGGSCPALQVYETVGGAVIDLKVNGQIQTGDGTPTNPGGVCLNSSCTQVVGNVKSANNTNNFGIINANGGINGLMLLGTNVGIGFPSAATAAAPLSTLDVNGTINFSDCVGAPQTAYAGGSASCPGPLNTQYATFAPGLFTHYQTASDIADDVGGKMYCCPCPAAGCPP
ncbi:MAG: hypothetical protein ACHQ51_07465 [Elusimicrobiota bacterium]